MINRTEVELSLAWGKENPSLFVDAVVKFQEEHPTNEWDLFVNIRQRGSMTLIARRAEYDRS